MPCMIRVQKIFANSLMFKLVLEKAEEPEIKLPTSTGSSKKQENSRKTSISALFFYFLFFIMAVLVCIPTNSVRGFPFLHTLSSIYCL